MTNFTITEDNTGIHKETLRALAFLGRQIKKGWTVEEVFIQVENSYSYMVYQNVLYQLQRYDKEKSGLCR